MLHHRREFERGLLLTLTALAGLVLASPAPAGQQGNLQPAGKLLLELDAATSQFRLDDDDTATADPIQQIFDRKILKQKDACLVGLTPDGSDATDPNALVSLADSPTDWGIDTGKLALGGRTGKGTGCGQLEFGEIARIQVNSLLLTNANIQVEAKQDAAAKVTLILDDGTAETVVGTRYLLSGRATSNPPAEVVAAPPEHVSTILGRADGGPDSKEADDGFWIFEAPFHNVELVEILTNSDGTRGKLSIKGGGEFPDPTANRSEWTAFDPDGLLFCADGFSDESGAFSGIRTNEGACISRIPYESEFDGFEFRFEVLDPDDQGTAFAFRVQFDPEPAAYPIPKSVLAYAPEGIDCTGGVDVDDPSTFTDSCIGLTLCEGTPIRRCTGTEDGCQDDSDCADGSVCRVTDILPDDDGWPDLVSSSPTTVEYGCICSEHIVYLGGGLCEDGSGCEEDADCADSSTCELFSEDQMSVEQCIFALGDLKGSRRR